MRCGLLGEHLGHSFSPQIHAELGDYEYRLYEKTPDELEDFLLHGDFDGLNVTIPYKKAVIPFCSGLSDTARAIGSVNTLTRLPDGSLIGDNTDYYGFDHLLRKSGIDPAAGKTLILGSGGASVTVAAVLRSRSAREIVTVSRNGPDNYDNIGKHSDAVLIVNTTPVGMYPACGVSPLPDLGIFQSCRAVIDLIYNPPRTELILQAEERGIPGYDGLAMLSAQAKRAAELFTGRPIPDEMIDIVSSKIAFLTRNIVLIGMPGCGKTTVGEALGKLLGRECADTDARITEAAGKPIPAIFEKNGEDYFRDLETAALRELCKRSGLIIATGGGIVKRPENLRLMRQNAVIVFIDRDINTLQTSGRPLSQRDGVEALAGARLPLYRQWSDHTVKAHDIGQTVNEICSLLRSPPWKKVESYEKNTCY